MTLRYELLGARMTLLGHCELGSNTNLGAIFCRYSLNIDKNARFMLLRERESVHWHPFLVAPHGQGVTHWEESWHVRLLTHCGPRLYAPSGILPS
jgi:hypothetical protein